jgi:ribonuclease III
MTPIATIEELQKFIGYEFEDLEILEEARTRKAYGNENPSRTKECMDPLATLGDAILDAIVVLKLYEEGERRKGKLTENKIHNIKRKKTRAFAENNKLGKYIRWGKGEGQDEIWNKGDHALDTVTEALIGAVFLDAQKQEKNGVKVVAEMLEKLKFYNSK